MRYKKAQVLCSLVIVASVLLSAGCAKKVAKVTPQAPPAPATPTATQASKCASRFLNRCLESNRKTSASRTTTGESSIHGIQSRKAASAASRQVRGAGLTAPLR